MIVKYSMFVLLQRLAAMMIDIGRGFIKKCFMILTISLAG